MPQGAQVGFEKPPHCPVRYWPVGQLAVQARQPVWSDGDTTAQVPFRYSPDGHEVRQLVHWRLDAVEQEPVSYWDDEQTVHCEQTLLDCVAHVPVRYRPVSQLLVHGVHVGVLVAVHVPTR